MVTRRPQDTKLDRGLKNEEIGWLLRERGLMLMSLEDIGEVEYSINFIL